MLNYYLQNRENCLTVPWRGHMLTDWTPFTSLLMILVSVCQQPCETCKEVALTTKMSGLVMSSELSWWFHHRISGQLHAAAESKLAPDKVSVEHWHHLCVRCWESVIIRSDNVQKWVVWFEFLAVMFGLKPFPFLCTGNLLFVTWPPLYLYIY